MRRSLLGGLTAAAALVLAFAMLLLVALAADEEARADEGTAGVVCAPPGPPGDEVAGFDRDQLTNAALIVAAGKETRLPQQAWVTAVATAMQESNLLVYANSTVPASLDAPHQAVGSDHDSVGLFQQRPSWGSLQERMDPKTSALLFYQRLVEIPGWKGLPLTVAAQRVQSSAFPDAYAKWEQPARAVVGSVEGIECRPGAASGEQVSLPNNPRAEKVVNAALSQVGKPYAWGGGDASGPTRGISDGGGPADQAGDYNKVGFDCSGLALYAYAQIDVTVPHQTQAIWSTFQPAITDPAAVQPGDLILLSDDGSPTGIHHVAIYMGGGRVVEAPQSGKLVRVTDNIWQSSYWTGEFIGAVRPGVTDARA